MGPRVIEDEESAQGEGVDLETEPVRAEASISSLSAGALSGMAPSEAAVPRRPSLSSFPVPSSAEIVQTLGFGGVLGFCTGYALKQTAKVVAVFVGGSVAALQLLQFAGYIEVKWSRIEAHAKYLVGDEFNITDLVRRLVKMVAYKGPGTAGGFAMGIYVGLMSTS